MEVLALEPYLGGSHEAFLGGWAAASRHRFTVLGLPPGKWKWRMRHGAITLAERAAALLAKGRRWDLLLASDMLNLAELAGLAPAPVRDLPRVVYFHENQVTYPVRVEKERDYHFGLTNLTTALAADAVWFNSAFHRDDFLAALPRFLKRMPDHRPLAAVEAVRARSSVEPPGIDEPARRPRRRRPGPLRILWAARWEHDKDPATFFSALSRLTERGVDFRVSVLGQRFGRVPGVFERARQSLGPRVVRWGFLEPRSRYLEALADADVFVSTARHEFFGLSAVEAMAAGAYPLLPRRLSYPELLSALPPDDAATCLYGGGPAELARRLEELAHRLEAGALWRGDPTRVARAMAPYRWSRRAPELDRALEAVAGAG